MQIIRGLINLKPIAGSVVTIGNFDGVHLGHQQILRQLIRRAKSLCLPAVVILFEPQPKEYFAKNIHDITRITTFREKINLLATFGVDKVICLHFNEKLISQAAKVFFADVLLDKLKVNYLVVGDDFCFGKDRLGDVNLLREFAKQNNFLLEVCQSFIKDGLRISSTKIRELLAAGDLAKAERLLGRRYSVFGKVIHGAERGRELNFPTANIHLRNKTTPISGVFIVQVLNVINKPIPGVANIGFRPTVGDNKRLLEFFLFDFDADIYGKLVKIEFLQKIRDEVKFANLALLQQQIQKDVVAAKKYFETKKR